MSLRLKLVLLVVGLTTGLLGGLGLVLGLSLQGWTEQVLDDELRRRAEVLINEAHRDDDRLELDDDDDLATRGLPFRIEDPGGAVLLGSETWPLAGAAELGLSSARTSAGARVRVLSVRFTPRGGDGALVLRVAAPLTALANLAGRFRDGLLVAVLLAAALGALGAALLAQWVLAPLRRLSASVDELEARALTGRLDPAGLDPALARLARSFNALLERVAVVLEGQRQFVARASHALRTPLSSILTQAEVSARRERSLEHHQHTLASIAEVARDASRMTDGLLALTRADAPAAASTKVLPLTRLAGELERLFRPRAEAAGIALELEAPEGLALQARSNPVREALDAVLDNALRYTPRGGTVRFVARAEGAAIVLEVVDSGPGIAAEERERVLERFQRGAAAVSTGQPGSGLGLSVVKALMTAEGGTVRLEAAPGGGTRVVLTFPGAARAGGAAPSKRPRPE